MKMRIDYRKFIIDLDPNLIDSITTSYQNNSKYYEFITRNYIQNRGDKVSKVLRFAQNNIAKIVLDYECFIKPEEFKNVVRIEEDQRYTLIRDYLNNTEISKTKWYELLINNLRFDGIAAHKSIRMYNEEEIVNFFKNYINPLLESIVKNGILQDEKFKLEGEVLLDWRGRFIKSSHANHRFIISRELRVRKVPLIIAGVSRKLLLTNGIRINDKRQVSRFVERLIKEYY